MGHIYTCKETILFSSSSKEGHNIYLMGRELRQVDINETSKGRVSLPTQWKEEEEERREEVMLEAPDSNLT